MSTNNVAATDDASSRDRTDCSLHICTFLLCHRVVLPMNIRHIQPLATAINLESIKSMLYTSRLCRLTINKTSRYKHSNN